MLDPIGDEVNLSDLLKSEGAAAAKNASQVHGIGFKISCIVFQNPFVIFLSIIPNDRWYWKLLWFFHHQHYHGQ